MMHGLLKAITSVDEGAPDLLLSDEDWFRLSPTEDVRPCTWLDPGSNGTCGPDEPQVFGFAWTD
jgi:hypothetical protein